MFSSGRPQRNAGGMAFCATEGLRFVADFSLNAANELTVEYLKAKGAERVTASYDLSAEQLLDLLKAVPGDWLEVVIHQHMPMFHMEHCVFCAFLSPGTDHTNCGRPCDEHDVKLRDRVGMEHPLKADVGCRNTLFNAVPQTAAEHLGRLQAEGARQRQRLGVGDVVDGHQVVGHVLEAGAVAERPDLRQVVGEHAQHRQRARRAGQSARKPYRQGAEKKHGFADLSHARAGVKRTPDGD